MLIKNFTTAFFVNPPDGNEVQSQDVIFKNRIGRIRDIDMNSKGEIFLINSNSNASLWKFEKIIYY